MIVPAIPMWEKSEEEFREDGRAIIQFDLGIDYREINCDDWPQAIYECIWDRECEIWIMKFESEKFEKLAYPYSAPTLEILVDYIQEDLVVDSAVYDIFYCHIKESEEY